MSIFRQLQFVKLAKRNSRKFGSLTPQNNLERTSSAILCKSKNLNLISVLSHCKRPCITLEEFNKLCEKIGIDQTESDGFLKSLDNSGVVIFVKDKNSVVVKPQVINEKLNRVLGLKDKHVIEFISKLESELSVVNKEYEELKIANDLINKRAFKYAKRVLRTTSVGLAIFSGVVFRLTFWDLSWDIMEPVTYMFNLIFINTSLIFFLTFEREYKYSTLHGLLENSKKKHLYKSLNFSFKHFEALSKQREILNQKISSPVESFYKDLVLELDRLEEIE